MIRFLSLASFLIVALPAFAQDRLDPEVEALKKMIDDKSADRDKLRADILKLVKSRMGTPAAMQASGLLPSLPSPLDKLDPKQIPELDRFDWQPKELVAVLGEHRGRQASPVSCVAYGKDKEGKRVFSGGTNGHVRIWDAATLRLWALLGTGHATTCIAVSHDGKTLAAGSAYGLLWVWDISGSKPVETGRFQIGTSSIHSVDISPDNKILAAGVYDGLIHTFDLDGSKPKERTQLSGHKTAVRAVSFAPTKQQLAGAAADGSIRWWAFEGDRVKELGTLSKVHTSPIASIAHHPNGGTLAVGCDDGSMIRINITGVYKAGLPFKTPSAITCIGHSPGGTVTTSHADGKVRTWGTATIPTVTSVYEGHYGSVAAFEWSKDGRSVVTGGADWTVRTWQAGAKPVERLPLKGHLAVVNQNDFAPDGASLATAGEDRSARIWNLAKASPSQTASLNKDNTSIHTLAHSPDGKFLATGGASVIARLWDLSRRTEQRNFPGHPSYVRQLHFHPDGKRLVASSDRHVVVWNAETAREIFRFEGHEKPVNSMSMSPDGRYVLTGTGYYQYDATGKIVTIKGEYQYVDCTIRLWDLTDGRMKKDITNLPKPISNVTFSPNGRTFAASFWHTPSSMWEASPTALTKKADIKNTSIWTHLHAFSPDGKRLVTLGNDYKLRLTDPATDKVLKEWSLAETIRHVTFSPDSRYLAVSIQPGPVYILRLDEPNAGAGGK